jgi:protein SCO1/2
MRALVALAALGGVALADLPPAARAVDLEEHLGQRLPLGLGFRDQRGASVQLGDYFTDHKPVLLVLAWFRCASLCDLVLGGAAAALRQSGLASGRDYRALTVSIDPNDTPARAEAKQRALLQTLGPAAAARDWPFLVATAPAAAALADRLGFRYAYDPKSDQYAHPACAFVIAPDGRISRYLYGVGYRPVDMRLALVEAARGRVGTLVDRLLLTCYRYDPASRRYGLFIDRTVKGGGALVLLIVACGLGALWRRERRA